jgi:hypothetical protein
MEACFYECEPNTGLYHKFNDSKTNHPAFNEWQMHKMPIKRRRRASVILGTLPVTMTNTSVEKETSGSVQRSTTRKTLQASQSQASLPLSVLLLLPTLLCMRGRVNQSSCQSSWLLILAWRPRKWISPFCLMKTLRWFHIIFVYMLQKGRSGHHAHLGLFICVCHTVTTGWLVQCSCCFLSVLLIFVFVSCLSVCGSLHWTGDWWIWKPFAPDHAVMHVWGGNRQQVTKHNIKDDQD